MTKAIITGDILSWARRRADFSIDDLAVMAHVKPEQIEQWEQENNNYPTFRQAQTLAKKLHIPFGYLFLTEPPTDQPKIPDLRTIADEQRNHFSLNFTDVLADALIKQNWYRDVLLEKGAEALPFIGKYTIDNAFTDVAADIADILGLDTGFRRSCSSWEAFLSNLIDRTEEQGILVLRNGVVRNNNNRKLSVAEFRGFALVDSYAPIIFLNNTDAKAAQIFTLAHELAHLWIGEAGVSNISPGKHSDLTENRIEKFCNRVAAEILVPQQEFLAAWNNEAHLPDNLIALGRLFRVSSLVLLIRAKELQKITSSDFYIQYQQELDGYTPSKKASGGDFRNTLPVRNSKTLTRAVIISAFNGQTMYREAASILGVKRKTLGSLADHLGIR